MCCQSLIHSHTHIHLEKNKFGRQTYSYSLHPQSTASHSAFSLASPSTSQPLKKNYYVRPKPTPESQPSRKKRFVFNGFWLSDGWRMEDGGGAGRRSWSDRAEEAEESALDPGYIFYIFYQKYCVRVYTYTLYIYTSCICSCIV